MAKTSQTSTKKKQPAKLPVSRDYLVSMRYAPKPGTDSPLLVLLPAIIFSAIVIMIVRHTTYTRSFGKFSWTPQGNDTTLSDFFSYNKMVLVLICAGFAILVLLYKLCTESLAIKRSSLYIPMAVYAFFVILSYICSDLKDFALLGWTDRLEGTLPLLAYMIMLFFVMNYVEGEKNVKQIFWPIAVSSVILNILGFFQSFGKDFFQTRMGQKFICANYQLAGGARLYDLIDERAAAGEQYFSFAFNRIAYQTVYNPNYVSFYLTLLIPLFTMLLLRSLLKDSKEKWYKSAGLLVLIGLQLYNVMASKSAGGYVGLAVSFVLALIVLNKKLLKWWKPLVIFLLVAVLALGATFSTWSGEIASTLSTVGEKSSPTHREVTASIDELIATVEPSSYKSYIDYMHTDADGIYFSIYGNPLNLLLKRDGAGNVEGLIMTDGNNSEIELRELEKKPGTFYLVDSRYYEYVMLTLSSDEDGNNFVTLTFYRREPFKFCIESDNIYYINPYGVLCVLDSAEGIGFKEDQLFGSSRGYIWSRIFPMLKDVIFVGHGADTFCAYFPQMDYTGKYNGGLPLETVVDKAHNMYLGSAVGTGVISILALLALFGIYIVQSLKLYVKSEFGSDYLMFAGSGIFLGISGFLVAGLVNDSSISVMPMFYTLLGTGIAINGMIKRRNAGKAIETK